MDQKKKEWFPSLKRPVIVSTLIVLALFAISKTMKIVWAVYDQRASAKMQCANTDPLACEHDHDCICTEEACFMGNRYYLQKCIKQEQEICLDLCGWGRGFSPVCDNGRCTNDY